MSAGASLQDCDVVAVAEPAVVVVVAVAVAIEFDVPILASCDGKCEPWEGCSLNCCLGYCPTIDETTETVRPSREYSPLELAWERCPSYREESGQRWRPTPMHHRRHFPAVHRWQ